MPTRNTTPGAQPYVPHSHSLKVLARTAQSCHGCDLYKDATRAVFGEGPAGARLVLVGEVPGDREDLAGHVFVGPAGKLLDDALAEVGLARAEVYLTNAVKHFKYTRRGKRRIHSKPSRYEVVACRPWLEQELAIVQPEVLVLLGAVAAQSLLGAAFRVTQRRGEVFASPFAPATLATVHPASVLRAGPDPALRREARARFVADLAAAKAALAARR